MDDEETVPDHLVITMGQRPRRGEMDKPGLQCAACGCTQERACAGGCYWILPGLCSRCALKVELVSVAAPRPDDPRLRERVGAGK